MEWLGIHPYQTSKYDLKKYLKNIPIKLEGIKISQDVCGTSITALKGKTTHIKTQKFKLYRMNIPETTNIMHRNMMLYSDIFFLKNTIFDYPDQELIYHIGR